MGWASGSLLVLLGDQMPAPQKILGYFFNWKSLNSIGQVTARILGFNDQPRVLERQLLIEKKKYPSLSAMRRMNS